MRSVSDKKSFISREKQVAVWPSQGGRNFGRQLSAVELILHSLNTQTQETAGEESGAVQVFAGHCRHRRTGPDAIQRSVTFQFAFPSADGKQSSRDVSDF
jgi:hypothetical protein